MKKLRHGSLFSGIGGFDLAAEWMGWDNVFHCEWNDFGQRVLKHYWPNAKSFGDITKTDFTKYHGTIDIISGGFPCQPYSQAGKRLGKEDDRHLWPEMLRAIREISPRYVVGENVRGLTNWNGGLVFVEVQADLEASGYQVTPFLLPACAVNAPHRRDRVWFVAYNHSAGLQETRTEQQTAGIKQHGKLVTPTPDTDNPRTDNTVRSDGYRQAQNIGREKQSQPEFRKNGCNAITPDTPSKSSRGQHEQRPEQRQFRGCNCKVATNTDSRRQPSKEHGQTESGRIAETSVRGDWQNFPTQHPICGRNDGLPTELDGITFPKWRNESIKAYGNAVVPQVVYQIFKTIQLFETKYL